MHTFYDYQGRPVAYCEDGQHVYAFDGEPVAYIDDDSIFTYAGRHLGWLDGGWIRDHDGACVLFCEVARGGPVRPAREMRPARARRRTRPPKAPRQKKPVREMDRNDWSPASGRRFFP